MTLRKNILGFLLSPFHKYSKDAGGSGIVSDDVKSFKKMQPDYVFCLLLKFFLDNFSDNITCQILCDYPVAVRAMKPFWQYREFALDWFVGIGNATRVGGSENHE